MTTNFLERIRDVLNHWYSAIPAIKTAVDSINSNTAAPGRTEISFTIPSGNQESDEIDCGNDQVVSLQLSAALDGTQFTLLGKYTAGGTYHIIMDQNGTDYVIPFVPDRKVSIEPATLLGYQFVKLKSDSSESAERSFKALKKHLG